MKLIRKLSNEVREVRVYRDEEWQEFVCRVWENGTENAAASYHTDDRFDALETADRMLAND